MRKSYLLYNTVAFALFIVAFASCRKENGIDNDSVIKKPYGLYLSDDKGAVYNSNDGNLYKSTFQTDGYPLRALTISGTNIIFVKANAHLSKNNGENFNPTYTKLNSFYLADPVYRPYQSIILNVPDQDRVYLCSIEGKGIVLSEDHGEKWMIDTAWDDHTNGGNINSFTQLKNGSLFAHGSNNDSIYKRDNKGDKWNRIENVNSLPGGKFYISHYNNTLVAVDYTGASGAYYSNDDGKNWSPYTGLPKRKLYAAVAPFESTLLVGTDSNGIYRLDANNNFIPSNNGLDDYTVVYGIVGKDDIFKNDLTKRYVYIATNKGIFRSEDLGQNWTLVNPGRFVGVY